jgi:hypothetical protein
MSQKSSKKSTPMLEVMREIGGCVRQAFCEKVGTTDIEGFQFVFDSNIAAFFATATVKGEVQEEVLEFDSIVSTLVVSREETQAPPPYEKGLEGQAEFLAFLGDMLEAL